MGAGISSSYLSEPARQQCDGIIVLEQLGVTGFTYGTGRLLPTR